jgi:3-methyladenine DNA glycosylase/8-oxoguanine DNA glycosylase
MTTSDKRIRVPVRKPFSVYATAISHGWYQTMPFRLDPKRSVLQRAEQLMDGSVVLLEIWDEPSTRRGFRDAVVEVHGERAGDPGVAEEMARRATVMLHLDEDLRGFYKLARERDDLAHVIEHGAGRIMRASTLWEDVVKTVLGTNVLWSQAVAMINRVAELGDPYPGDPTMRAWPGPWRVARVGERHLRDVVRAGYRAPYIIELAQRQKSGDIDLDAIEAQAETADAETLFKVLTKLKGVGKSSAHFLMNLLGHYDHISVDSATYAYAKRELFHGRRPSEKQIRKRFAEFGEWQSLVYWFARWDAQLAWWEDASGRSSA